VIDVAPWLWTPRPQPSAHTRLFCFPAAGSGASSYFPWGQTFDGTDLELCAIQLPGRENRSNEMPFRSMDALLPPLLKAIEPSLDRPFSFFGHSLGAVLAFELACQLRDRDWPPPNHLFLSASRPPHLPRNQPPVHRLPDGKFVDALVNRYQGIPATVLQDRELMDLFLPALRADITLLETYCYRPRRPLAVASRVFGGRADPQVGEADLQRWQDLTTGPFACELFEGGHFYLNDVRPAISATIHRDLGFAGPKRA